MMGNLTPFVVNGPPTTNTNTINFTGGPWTYIRTHVDSSAETIATWRLDEDTSSKITIENSSGTNATFAPMMVAVQSGTLQAFRLVAQGATDTGTSPLFFFESRIGASTAVSTRPLAGWYNTTSTLVALLSAGGVFKLGGTTTTLYGRPGQKLETNTSAAATGAAFNTWSADATGGIVDFNKSRSATIGTHSVLSSGDDIGRYVFRGSDGTNFIPAAEILSEVDGTPGTNDMPGRLTFSTTADGAAAVTERMRVTNAGDVGVGKTPTTGIILDVGGQLGLKSYTVATLPSASVQAGACVYASDAGGNGPCIAMSNGTNWKRCDNTGTTVS